MAKMDKIKFLSDIEVADKNNNEKYIFKVDQEDGTTHGTFLAKEVMLPKNFVMTKDFGTYKVTGNFLTINQDGTMTIADFLSKALCTSTTINPKITSFKVNNSTSPIVEEGATITPTYSVTMNNYGYASGDTPDIGLTYTVSFNNKDYSAASGSFESTTVNSSLKATATVTWNDCTVGDIKAGSASSSVTITTYKGCFYGTSDISLEPTGENVKSLLHSTNDNPPTKITINNPWLYYYIAVPEASNKTTVSVTDTIRNNVIPFMLIGETDVENDYGKHNNYKIFCAANTKAYGQDGQPTEMILTWS